MCRAKLLKRTRLDVVFWPRTFPKSLIIHGDGTDPELLSMEHLDHSDAFIALTDRDEDNLIISLYALQSGVPKVIAKSNRQNYYGIARSAGLESILSPKLITANIILKTVRGMQNSKACHDLPVPYRRRQRGGHRVYRQRNHPPSWHCLLKICV